MVMPRLTSSASVCLATTPLSQPAELTAWSVAFTPPARDRLPTTFIWLWNFASGARMGVISSAPAALGIQCAIVEPLGT